MDDRIWAWSACDVVDALENKTIKVIEVLQQLETRYSEVNPLLNALPTVFFEKAYSKVKRFETERIDFCSPLFGLPVPIKDSYCVKGIRTTFGSLAFENYVPKYSDIIVTTIEKSGGIIFAKSNTPEFEAGASTFNEVFGITRNPWNLKKSVAGSSGGAAASVAAGMAYVAQGSDFACSIRYPASFCGIIGLRPTPGTVPYGPTPLPYQTLSVQGPIARSVKDCGLALDAMSGYNVVDPLTNPIVRKGYRKAAEKPIKPPSCAFSVDLNIATVSSDVNSTINGAIHILEKAGLKVKATCPNLQNSDMVFKTCRAYQFNALWSDTLKQNRTKLKPEVISNIEQGSKITAEELANAEAERSKIRRAMLDFLEDEEFLISATAPVAPNLAEERYVSNISGVMLKSYIDWLILGYSISITGCPAISVPCGFNKEGLPIGMQIVAKPHCELSLLQFAAWIETTLDVQLDYPKTPQKKVDS